MDREVGSRASKTLITALITLIAAIFLFPLYWMMVLATQSNSNIYNFPPPLWFGVALYQNWQRLIHGLNLGLAMWNSFYVATFATILVLLVSSFAGYGFSRFTDAPGNKVIYRFMIGTLMIPGTVGLIPWFMLMKWFGWLNTYWPLIIPGAANAFGIFWMTQFIRESVPQELYDSARIDGASDWRIYYQIVLPLIRPGLSALGVLNFLGAWNNFQIPLIILNDKTKFTMPLALTELNSLYSTDTAAVMLGTAVSVLPIIVAFLFGTRYFISGLTSGAVKA